MEKKQKKEEVQETKIKKVKHILNNPLPMLIILTLIIVILLGYIISNSKESKIYVGSIVDEKLVVSNVHYFSNNDMNYFYATNAAYLDEDIKIYGFQIGYYAVSKENKYYELATRSGSLDNPSSIKEVVQEQSGWNISELAKNKYFFDDDVLKNLDNIHFVIIASSKKEYLNNPDIKLDYKVELTKITK